MARLHDPSDRLSVVGKRSTRLILALGVTVVVLISIQSNPRILVSWHGLLHAGIAEGIDLSRVPPENPFFAGEDPLPSHDWGDSFLVRQGLDYVNQVAQETSLDRILGPHSTVSADELQCELPPDGVFDERKRACVALLG